jgi:hypothetical protein
MEIMRQSGQSVRVEEAQQMAADELMTLVLGYDTVGVAMADFQDLDMARREGRVGDYEAAVVRRADSTHELVVSAVSDDNNS